MLESLHRMHPRLFARPLIPVADMDNSGVGGDENDDDAEDINRFCRVKLRCGECIIGLSRLCITGIAEDSSAAHSVADIVTDLRRQQRQHGHASPVTSDRQSTSDDIEIAPLRSTNASAAALLRERLRVDSSEGHHHDRTLRGTAVVDDPIGSIIDMPAPHPEDFQVLFLGTGCATPSKYRSGSSIMITAKDAHHSLHSCILDAGEGCTAQLWQHCSGDIERFYSMLSSVDVIWISHYHADHLCGVTALLEYIQLARVTPCSDGGEDAKALKRGKLLLIGSPEIIRYVEFATCVAGIDSVVEMVVIGLTACKGNPATSQMVVAATAGAFRALLSIPVHHCPNAYAIAIEVHAGQDRGFFRVVYSGDTRPSKRLICAGRHCDLLIHEATFEDDKADDAANKRHCTVSEAMHVASMMRARHVVLTHFSQRYCRAGPRLAEQRSRSIGEDCHSSTVTASFAYDFLRFSFPSQMDVIPDITTHIGEYLSSAVHGQVS